MILAEMLDSLTRMDGMLSDDLLASARSIEIKGIYYRAQEVRPGGLFVAIKGLTADGHDYIETAFANGAAAVVAQRPIDANGCVVTVPDTRRAMGELAARFYGDPSDRLVMIGVTGTNGKTTTSYLIESLLLSSGIRVGVVGTINYRYAGRTYPNPVTTPESVDLQRIMADMVAGGVTHLVMEASSHGIAQERIRGCRYDVALFTNLSQDHLDYHLTMGAYWECKRRLFTDFMKPAGGVAVVNCDDLKGKALAGELTTETLTVGSGTDCRIRPMNAWYDLSGIDAEIATPEGPLNLHSPLVGAFNLENVLLAVGTGIALKLSPHQIQTGIEHLAAVPGRLEPVPNERLRHVFVDFAHTPDALAHTLKALRSVSENRIISVFGCGGDRDRGKRPLMGEIGVQGSDFAIITSDNPRSEDPEEIIRQVIKGAKGTHRRFYGADEVSGGFDEPGYTVVTDRKSAIGLAVSVSKKEDIILIAGKGHETYQILADRTIEFNDVQVTAQALCTPSAA